MALAGRLRELHLSRHETLLMSSDVGGFGVLSGAGQGKALP